MFSDKISLRLDPRVSPTLTTCTRCEDADNRIVTLESSLGDDSWFKQCPRCRAVFILKDPVVADITDPAPATAEESIGLLTIFKTNIQGMLDIGRKQMPDADRIRSERHIAMIQFAIDAINSLESKGGR